jgi:hypothetical protein
MSLSLSLFKLHKISCKLYANNYNEYHHILQVSLLRFTNHKKDYII